MNKEYKNIEGATYLQWLAALILLILLSWMFIHSHHLDLRQYARMTLLLQDLSREDVIFQQKTLSIEGHHTHHYDDLMQSQNNMLRFIEEIQALDQKAVVSDDLAAYQTLMLNRNDLSHRFISSYAVMRNTMLSLPKSLTLIEKTVTVEQFYEISGLVYAAFRFHTVHRKEAYHKVKDIQMKMEGQAWAQKENIQGLMQHVALFVEESRKVRDSSKQIAALSGATYIHNMQKTTQHQRYEVEQLASRDNVILYMSCAVLLIIIVLAFMQVHRTTARLTKTVRDLRFQQHALDQHAIVSIADANGAIIYANTQFLENSQYSKEELLGHQHSIVKSNHHPKSFFTELWGTISSGQTWQGEMCNKRKDGTLFWVRTTIVPFMNEQHKPHRYIAIRTNISENKAMEAELKEHRSQLEEQVRQRTLSLQSMVQQLQQEIRTRKSAEHQLRLSIETAEKNVQLKSEFIANMNHELRTPLNAIIGFSDLLREGLVGPLSETQVDYINDIFDSGNRLLHLISDIMDLSKIESGMVELELEPVIFNDVLQNSLGMIQSKALSHHIQLSVEIDPRIEAVVLDVRKVKQMLFNLLSNAVKFTPPEGSVKVEVSLWESSDKAPLLSIAVHDTGIGISEEDLPKLFESFVQLDGSIDRHFEGTGLGLSLVKQLVDLHHGSLEVKSELGVGSCFTVKLPYSTDESAFIS